MVASKKNKKRKVQKSRTRVKAKRVKRKAKKAPVKKRLVKRKVVKKKKVVRKVRKTSKRKVVRSRIKSRIKKSRPLDLRRAMKNPIIGPTPNSYWESEAVFNPGAVVHGDKVHLFYRALGPDGVSRIGYAKSSDGVHFDHRAPHPVFVPEMAALAKQAKHHLHTSPARLSYDRVLYQSGGGWGGSEDPRVVKIDDRIYMTINIFNGWHSIRVGVTSISEEDLDRENWNWRRLVFLSPENQRHKNWVLFPGKVGGKYALFHNLHHSDAKRVRIQYLDNLEETPEPFESPDPHYLPDRHMAWHHRTRSVGPPPVKTKYGWLLFYHAMDPEDPNRYKLGVLLLDSKDPTKILYRSRYPILEPDEWYENDWKPGIIYASGAVVKGDTLFIYYGGGDKYVGVAYTSLAKFVEELRKSEHTTFSKKVFKVG